MTPEFHPAALEELAAAVKIGDMRAAGLGLELLRETQRVVALLCDLPDIGEPLDDRYRRFPLRRFPFGVVYRVDGSRVRIVAFAHRRLRPRYWARRK
ncbi:MAG: type II toxin-antitoxin system RelE/ParE family toxin [Steroidobacteraceae bacterium]